MVAIIFKACSAPFEFPAYDSTGHYRLSLITAQLSGITKDNFNNDPQRTIPSLLVGEQIRLIPDRGNKFDKYAVYATDLNDHYIGWIPQGYNSNIFNRLDVGETVLASVKDVWSFSPSSHDEDDEDGYDDNDDMIWMCSLNIAMYSKQISPEWTPALSPSTGRYDQPPAVYMKQWFIILMIILFFPVGLFLMWKYAPWNRTVKIIVTALFVLALIFP